MRGSDGMTETGREAGGRLQVRELLAAGTLPLLQLALVDFLAVEETPSTQTKKARL